MSRTERLDLEHTVQAPRLARRFVTKTLTGWGVRDGSIDRAQLLVSELVSNAVLHATGPIRLVVAEVDRGQAFRIEVCNSGAGTPRIRHAAPEDLSGRGLQLVDDLARGWGCTTNADETSVWFEVPADAAG
jgi:anti-sigma regulatory factor (Ser/Thr protein kinase)